MNENVITVKIADDGNEAGQQSSAPSPAGSRQSGQNPGKNTKQMDWAPQTKEPPVQQKQPKTRDTPVQKPKPKDDGVPIRTRPTTAGSSNTESLFNKFLAQQGGARGIANTAGQAAQGVAAGRGVASLAGAAGMATNALKLLGPIGIGVGAALAVASASAVAYGLAVDAATRRAQELERFNTQIAAANAKAEVRRLNADIRESQSMGKDYARLVDAQSRTEESFRRALLPLQEAFLSALVEIAEPVADLAEQARPLIRDVSKLVGAVLKGGAKLATIPVKLLIQVLEAVARFFNVKEDKPEEIPDTLVEVKKALDNIRLWQAGGANGAPDENGAVNAKKVPNAFR